LCTFCGGYDRYSSRLQICRSCLPKIKDDHKSKRCKVCQSLVIDISCDFCGSRNIFFERMEYLYLRDSFHKDIINRIKFGDQPYLNNYFRLGLNKKWKTFNFPRFTFFCSIPSNASTLKKRPISPISSVEYILNQRYGIIKEEFLIKISGENQSGKSYPDRFFHARNSMKIKEKFMGKISGNVLLVDDIFTTGATMNEASRILMENGANAVYLLALLRGE